jgi:hypothetical protein
MAKFAEIRDPTEYEKALKCARGCYQRNILAGVEALSGSTLSGTARSYGYWYKRSRTNLLQRMSDANVCWAQVKGPHGRKMLILGA